MLEPRTPPAGGVHVRWSGQRHRGVLVSALAGVTLLAWIVTVQQMRGMDAGPGTDLGALGWFVGLWVTMMAAMMLPSAMPTVLLVVDLRRTAQTWVFVSGYLLAWAGYGLAAYGLYRGLRLAAPSFLAWDERGPWVAGGALVAAGLYQLTPLKQACLRHCRSPMHFLLRGRPGWLGALRLGLEHGIYCVGCCAGLMLTLFAVGLMSLFWMAVVTVLVLIEKVLPGGDTFARSLAILLVALGLWIALSPDSVPALRPPAHPMEMQ